MAFEPFISALSKRGIELTRGRAHILQINMGSLCNQACRHCHLEAGPHSSEVMSADTMNEVVAFAGRAGFQTVDITGGAPEMNPHLKDLIVRLSSFVPRILLRSNLTAVAAPERDFLLALCKEHRIVIIASLPSLNVSQTDAQRGKGVWERSLATLRKLNALGYGLAGSGLDIHLVANPTGAFLPASQAQAEKKFRRDLHARFGIVFNNLYTFANVPLGRFRRWLVESGNFESYMEKLVSSFNPCTIEGLMCRTLVSVSWEGCLYDCDFNLANGMFLAGKRIHVSRLDGPPAAGTPIAVSDHCYACTAGSGFT